MQVCIKQICMNKYMYMSKIYDTDPIKEKKNRLDYSYVRLCMRVSIFVGE